MLARARRLAADTPATRNRYIDFLRAASIVAVVLGHWLVITPWVDSTGVFHPDHLLTRSGTARWLTWLFQVMPVFFAVGGYANAASWEAAQRRGSGYGAWLHARLRRLVGPAVPLLVLWLGLTALTPAVFPAVLVETGSIGALSPLWFLAVYVAVVALTPATLAAWDRFGHRSIWVPVIAALAVDWVWLAGGPAWPRWANYALIWPAIFQIGYAWREGLLGGVRARLTGGFGALAAAWLVVTFEAYPVAMIGVPGAEISNSAPPTAALLLLGVAQVLLASTLEGPARRWLSRSSLWTATVLVNGIIMTLFVWHYTVMVVPAVSVATWLGGFGLHLVPNTAGWWWSRPLWLAVLLIVMALLLPLLVRFERSAPGFSGSIGTARQVAAALLAIVGFAVVALVGTNGGVVGRWVFPALPIVAMALARPRT